MLPYKETWNRETRATTFKSEYGSHEETGKNSFPKSRFLNNPTFFLISSHSLFFPVRKGLG
jgi:hypothetical protein